LTAGGAVLRISRISEGVEFWIHVTPRASRPAVAGCRDDALRVAVCAPPLDGLANAACVQALAKALGVERRAIALDPRSRGRRKRVRVNGDPDDLSGRLARLAAGGGSD
jgi:uncharacterized protein YggU (UPF0235/DUF167 family)